MSLNDDKWNNDNIFFAISQQRNKRFLLQLKKRMMSRMTSEASHVQLTIPAPHTYIINKVTWHTTKFGDPYLEFVALAINSSKVPHTQQWTHTHTHTTPWTHHPEQWASHLCWARGSSWGVRCLAQDPPQSCIWGWRECVDIHSPTTILPDWDSNSQHFNFESDSLTIRCIYPVSQ